MISEIYEYFKSKESKITGKQKIKWHNVPKSIYEKLDSFFPQLDINIKSKKNLILAGYYDIDDLPKCPICGNPVRIYGRSNKLFFKTCSTNCENKLRFISTTKTNLNRYNCENVFQFKDIKEKIKKTTLEKYGVENIRNSEHYKNVAYKTNIEKYGHYNPFGNDKIKEKIKNTNLKRYGNTCAFANKDVQNKCSLNSLISHGTLWPSQDEFVKEKMRKTVREKYGVDYTLQLKHVREARSKINPHGRASNGFNPSKSEHIIYNLLNEIFSYVEWGRKDNKYPYWCDFYIPEIDTYIEFQGYWTHGNHPFNENSLEDIQRLNWLKEHANKSKLYTAAINVWTKIDPQKRIVAKENNLNYIEFWSINEVKEWLKKFE